MFSLEGKNAYITGGASGIGRAVAERFIAAGANVVITDITDGNAVAEEIGALFIQVDVGNSAQVSDSFTLAEKKIGKLDIVVNNAGRGDIGFDFDETAESLFDGIMNVNQKGVFLGLKYAPNHMNDNGTIINTSSLAASVKMLGTGVYSASKAAVVSMTKMAAIELADRQITVNAVCPSYVATALGNAEEGDMIAEAFVPLKRVATTDDISGIYHFLASAEASYITGQAIIADGGWSAGPSRNLMKLATGRNKTKGY